MNVKKQKVKFPIGIVFALIAALGVALAGLIAALCQGFDWLCMMLNLLISFIFGGGLDLLGGGTLSMLFSIILPTIIGNLVPAVFGVIRVLPAIAVFITFLYILIARRKNAGLGVCFLLCGLTTAAVALLDLLAMGITDLCSVWGVIGYSTYWGTFSLPGLLYSLARTILNGRAANALPDPTIAGALCLSLGWFILAVMSFIRTKRRTAEKILLVLLVLSVVGFVGAELFLNHSGNPISQVISLIWNYVSVRLINHNRLLPNTWSSFIVTQFYRIFVNIGAYNLISIITLLWSYITSVVSNIISLVLMVMQTLGTVLLGIWALNPLRKERKSAVPKEPDLPNT